MRILLHFTAMLTLALRANAATTITTTNASAYGANIGWIDWRGDTNNGAVIGEFVCSGYLYSANAGWIHLGGGAPANGFQYQNDSAVDYGVNHDGVGNLRGFAWGANIGWINFEGLGAPKVDLATGRLSGSAYGANVGWISLSNAMAHVQTLSIPKGPDKDEDGITDAWEFSHTNSLDGLSAVGDADGDGASDLDEYLADTDPLDPNDNLRIISITHGTPTPTYTTLTWLSQPTRFYAVETRTALSTNTPWADYFVFPWPGGSGLGFDQFSDASFYRVRAFRPLTP